MEYLTAEQQDLIQKLLAQNKLPDTTEAQRSANLHRIQWIGLMNRPKQPAEPYVRLDVVSERLRDPNFTCAPESILQKG
ncbi:Uncharacterised protein [Acinetobacter baumannii]|nr:Uncharacterised protein [Acinetobacter baumannii]